ncbi:MAG TPA: TIGR01212 family radical SAM protein [Deltaproteobacteria bacterium]|nr:TIGR01212 family radical SAM protein [Deltaproteobacteria bacterium]HPR54408.1 TIGR01212 family radical SAM protein [Deltaproteobacteria bacterium]HXK46263.1 TIGR01212 family radical SAM protein [Deltaproteobacteria bacterium]
MTAPPYRTLSAALRERFGTRVRKITLDAGLTCPHRDADGGGGCIYCNALGSGTGAMSRGMSLEEQLVGQIRAMGRTSKVNAFIAYFQSFSNTYAPVDVLRSIYDTVLPFPEIVGLSIGTRPDCIDEERLDLITRYTQTRLVWMEYGLQSANDKTLQRINRGHDVQTFASAVDLTSRYPMRICAHVILGLPGEGMADYLRTAGFLSSLPVTDVKIHLLYVIRGTSLERMLQQGLYRPLSMQEYAEATARFIGNLREDIVIQRITGDPHVEELVEPQWALERSTVRNTILREMELSGIVQGSLIG